MSRSGRQAQLAESRGRAGGAAAARSPKLKWPLRVVVEQTTVVIAGYTVARELLECGHTIGQARDMIGDRYPKVPAQVWEVLSRGISRTGARAMTLIARYIACKVWCGHEWGAWDSRTWENLIGVVYRVRWCKKCGTAHRELWW
jgi:hypothetical protein